MSISEMTADLAATQRDIGRLEAIVENLREFINDACGEDRRAFKIDLMKLEVALEHGRKLSKAISRKIAEDVRASIKP